MSRLTSLGLLTALALGAPTIASAVPERPVAAQVALAPAPTPAAARDSARYAEREQQDKRVASYQGGSVIVIGVSGGAVLVALLVLLLLI